MEIKFDTKPTYTVITPVTEVLNVNLSEQLRQNIDTQTNNGVQNFIIDLQHCTKADNTSPEEILQLHEHCYENQHSLVFINLQTDVAEVIKKNDIDRTLNIAPTMIEAVDIVSMEILERDLMN